MRSTANAIADRIVLPGVGSSSLRMRNIRTGACLTKSAHKVERGTPFLGACLGMQLMASSGGEGSRTGPIEGWGSSAARRPATPRMPKSAYRMWAGTR